MPQQNDTVWWWERFRRLLSPATDPLPTFVSKLHPLVQAQTEQLELLYSFLVSETTFFSDIVSLSLVTDPENADLTFWPQVFDILGWFLYIDSDPVSFTPGLHVVSLLPFIFSFFSCHSLTKNVGFESILYLLENAILDTDEILVDAVVHNSALGPMVKDLVEHLNHLNASVQRDETVSCILRFFAAFGQARRNRIKMPFSTTGFFTSCLLNLFRSETCPGNVTLCVDVLINTLHNERSAKVSFVDVSLVQELVEMVEEASKIYNEAVFRLITTIVKHKKPWFAVQFVRAGLLQVLETNPNVPLVRALQKVLPEAFLLSFHPPFLLLSSLMRLPKTKKLLSCILFYLERLPAPLFPEHLAFLDGEIETWEGSQEQKEQVEALRAQHGRQVKKA